MNKARRLCLALAEGNRSLSLIIYQGVLNRIRTLSEDIGKRLADALGVSWDVVKKPEAKYMRELMTLWRWLEFLQEPGQT